MQTVPQRYEPVFFKRELKRLNESIRDLNEKISVPIVGSNDPQTALDVDSERLYFHRDQDDFGFLLLKHRGVWFQFSGGNIITGGGSILGLTPGNVNNVVYDDGTTWVSGAADAANLMDKTTAQSISAIKTYTSGLKTSAQDAIHIDPHDTGAGNTGELRFYELTANGTNYAAFKGADNQAATVTYTLPNSAPASDGDALVSTTAGVLSWATISSGISIGDSIGSATSKSILYIDASGQLAEDTTNLVYDHVNNRIGIGTNAPSVDLHVDGDVLFQSDTDSQTGFQVLDSDGGDPVLNVDTINERVGIGTATPFVDFVTVDGDITAEGLHINAASNYGYLLIEGGHEAGIILGSKLAAGSDDTITKIVQFAGTGKIISLNDDGTTKVDNIISWSGSSADPRVGIGVNYTGYACSIGGNRIINFSGGAGAILTDTNQSLEITAGSGSTGVLKFNATQYRFNGYDPGQHSYGFISVSSTNGGIKIKGGSAMTHGYFTIVDSSDVMLWEVDTNGYFQKTAPSTSTPAYWDWFTSTSTGAVGIGTLHRYRAKANGTQEIGVFGFITTASVGGTAWDADCYIEPVTASSYDTRIIFKNTGAQQFWKLSSTTLREIAEFVPSFIVDTDASYTSRFKGTITDYVATRDWITVDADGTEVKIGLYGATAVARHAGFTQTYSTATSTHAARTAASLTDNSGGTADATVQALTDPSDSPADADALRDDLVANLIPELRNNIADIVSQINKIITDSNNSAQVLNELIDLNQDIGTTQ